MPSRIDLTRFEITPVNRPQPDGQFYPLEVLATGVGIDDKIFVYQVGDEDDPLPGDKFQKVATVSDLYEIPDESGVAIDAEGGIPYYRTNLARFVFRTQGAAEEFFEKLKQETKWLATNWDAGEENLTGTETVRITADSIETLEEGVNMPIRHQLDYRPAGDATYNNGVQGITNPDDSLTGWLPISEVDVNWNVPNGAVLFYNIAKDQTLADIFPPDRPYSSHLLYYNGLALPFGTVWTLTEDTIWWLEYDPSSISQMSSNMPWPTDYVDRSNPGSVSPTIELFLFQS